MSNGRISTPIIDGNDPPHLPVELTDCIIDVLGDASLFKKDDVPRHALRMCMTTSRAFFMRARKHLFRRVIRRPFRKEVLDPQELEFLRETPFNWAVSRILLVREAEITFEWWGRILMYQCTTTSMSDTETNPSAWGLAPLRSFLEEATRLESCSFGSTYRETYAGVYASFIPVISSSTSITTLAFNGMTDFPMDALSHCLNLQHLSLNNIRPRDATEGGPWNTDSFSNIKILQLNCAYMSKPIFPLIAFENKHAFTTLVEASFKLDTQILPSPLQELEIIHRAKDSLLSLTINTVDLGHESSEDILARGTFDLARLKKLKYLHVVTAVKPTNPFPMRFQSLLMEICSPLPIDNLALTFDFLYLGRAVGSRVPQSRVPQPIPIVDEWSELEDVLLDRGSFPNLALLQVCFKIKSDPDFRPRGNMHSLSSSTGPPRSDRDDALLACLSEFSKVVFPKLREYQSMKYTVDEQVYMKCG